MFDMTEGRGAEGKDWGANLSVRDDLDAKDIGEAGPAIVTKGAEDEVLALLIEYENA